VLRADRFSDLARADTTRDYLARRWLHMFPDDMLPAAVITLKEGNIPNYPIPATHGSPHNYDAHVPIVFYGPPFKPGQYRTFARTVDMAPTLARILGITPAERLDGHPLMEAIR
jgi:predicted AlkP superfamily pyrophosphatase or phosphodiesterase